MRWRRWEWEWEWERKRNAGWEGWGVVQFLNTRVAVLTKRIG